MPRETTARNRLWATGQRDGEGKGGNRIRGHEGKKVFVAVSRTAFHVSFKDARLCQPGARAKRDVTGKR
jgi:hypothetical protein